jgi:hypothetical protein
MDIISRQHSRARAIEDFHNGVIEATPDHQIWVRCTGPGRGLGNGYQKPAIAADQIDRAGRHQKLYRLRDFSGTHPELNPQRVKRFG